MLFTMRQARDYAHKTQQECADFLGIHVQTYRRIEENSKTATIEQARKFSDFTGVPFDSIVF